MKANLQQLEEMQKELFRQQCDLDIQEAMVKHFIKKKKAEQLNLTGAVKQSELLIAFAEWKEYNGKWETHKQQVKNFLKEYKSN